MRKFFASLGVLCLASAASAQTISLLPMNTFGYDDGSGEIAWKANNPSTSSDWFNVDFGSDASGAFMAGLWADQANTGLASPVQTIGYAPSVAAGIPDLSMATLQGAVCDINDGFNSQVGYATPCMDPGSDFQVVLNHNAGDTICWLVSDTSSPYAGRAYFSSDSYTTTFFGMGNLRMGFAGYASDPDGTLLVNGGSSATIAQTQEVCLTFSACQAGVGSSLYLCSPIFFGPLIPAFATVTGNPFFGGPCSNQWTICATITCNDPTGGPFGFCTIYSDPCDLKSFNGKPKSKVSTTATLTINPNGSCGGCYGQLDDGIVDANIWKVQNPASTGDWFNVNHGLPAPASAGLVNTLTGVQVSSWDFCGSGPCWAEIGAYGDSSGTPTGLAVTAGNPCMAPLSADGGPYPMTTYDIPDTPIGSASGWHVAAKWPLGDSCIWLGSDTDGVDSTCGTIIPSAGTTSGFAADNYASGAVGFTGGNWCMKLDWN